MADRNKEALLEVRFVHRFAVGGFFFFFYVF